MKNFFEVRFASLKRYLLKICPFVSLAAVMILSSVVVYAPYFSNLKIMPYHVDGILFAAIAKHGYNFHPMAALFQLPPYYFISHNLMYPLLIRLVAFLPGINFPAAMMLASLLASMVAVQLFYVLLKTWELVRSPFWVAFLFCFIPVNSLHAHVVGCSEPLFFVFTFAAFIAYKKEKPILTAFLISLAGLTRYVGVLLGFVFMAAYFFKREWKRGIWAIGACGLSLLILAVFCHVTYGDFSVFLKYNMGKGIVTPKLFPIFYEIQSMTSHLDYLALQYYIVLFSLYILGTGMLFKHREIFFYCLFFLVFTAFTDHPDFGRYLLPLAPFALLVNLDPILPFRPVQIGIVIVCCFNIFYVSQILPANLHPNWQVISLLF